ncbi:MAG TPA: hypothetical protein VJ865_08845, partial [Gemmatimonadaceae bacterium]|nr:hypothetical protein [Gemmatimonadaceae bacterium]
DNEDHHHYSKEYAESHRLTVTSMGDHRASHQVCQTRATRRYTKVAFERFYLQLPKRGKRRK